MLAVDRNDLAAAAPAGVRHERPAHHERLLVRERDALARAERGERRLESRGADDGVEHDVDVIAPRGLDEARLAEVPAGGAIDAPFRRTMPDERGRERARLLAEQRSRCRTP